MIKWLLNLLYEREPDVALRPAASIAMPTVDAGDNQRACALVVTNGDEAPSAERVVDILNLGWGVLAAQGEERRELEAELKARYGVVILD